MLSISNCLIPEMYHTFILRVVGDVALAEQHVLPAILGPQLVGHLLADLRIDVAY